MGTPLHKWWGVTFLHASVGAWFLILIFNSQYQYKSRAFLK